MWTSNFFFGGECRLSLVFFFFLSNNDTLSARCILYYNHQYQGRKYKGGDPMVENYIFQTVFI